MTEEDAKKKFCPMKTAILPLTLFFARSLGLEDGGMDELAEKSHACDVSDCAMWVATDNEYQPSNVTENGLSSGKSKPAGHCGLINQ